MNPQPHQSDALADIEYDADRGTLKVQFRDQSTYEYTGVPTGAYAALLSATSKGGYFNRYIRGRYPHTTLIRLKSRGLS